MSKVPFRIGSQVESALLDASCEAAQMHAGDFPKTPENLWVGSFSIHPPAPIARRAPELPLEPPRKVGQIGKSPIKGDRADVLSGHVRIPQISRRSIEAPVDQILRECAAGPFEQLVHITLADADRGGDRGNRQTLPVKAILDGTA
jgi:hypothetical protein